MRWNPEFTSIVPNVAERWESNEDATEVTFYLREGMKWSDGVPFTADDILFNVNDLIRNTDYAPTHPRYMSGGEAMSVEKVDEENYRVTGDLTIKGTAKPITFDLEYSGTAVDPFGNTRIGFEATTKINRKDFGMEFNLPIEGGGFVVGDTVKIATTVRAERITS